MSLEKNEYAQLEGFDYYFLFIKSRKKMRVKCPLEGMKSECKYSSEFENKKREHFKLENLYESHLRHRKCHEERAFQPKPGWKEKHNDNIEFRRSNEAYLLPNAIQGWFRRKFSRVVCLSRPLNNGYFGSNFNVVEIGLFSILVLTLYRFGVCLFWFLCICNERNGRASVSRNNILITSPPLPQLTIFFLCIVLEYITLQIYHLWISN